MTTYVSNVDGVLGEVTFLCINGRVPAIQLLYKMFKISGYPAFTEYLKTYKSSIKKALEKARCVTDIDVFEVLRASGEEPSAAFAEDKRPIVLEIAQIPGFIKNVYTLGCFPSTMDISEEYIFKFADTLKIQPKTNPLEAAPLEAAPLEAAPLEAASLEEGGDLFEPIQVALDELRKRFTVSKRAREDNETLQATNKVLEAELAQNQEALNNFEELIREKRSRVDALGEEERDLSTRVAVSRRKLEALSAEEKEWEEKIEISKKKAKQFMATLEEQFDF